MRRMRRKDQQEDIMVHAVRYPFTGNMTIVSVADEKTIFSRSFFARLRLKTSGEPLHSMNIASPPFRIASKSPIAMDARRNPLSRKVLCSKNDKRRNKTSISANALHH